MPRYVTHPKYPKFEIEVPDDATDEQTRIKMTQFEQERDREQIQVGQAHQAATPGLTEQLIGFATAPVRGLMKVPEKAVEMGRGLYEAGKGLVTGKWLEPLLEQPAEVPPATGPNPSFGEAGSPLGYLMGWERPGQMEPMREAPGKMAREAVSLAPAGLGLVGAAGGPLTAGAGVMTGESIRQAVERSVTASKGQPVQDPTEMLSDLFATGYLGAAGEVLPQAAVKAVSGPAQAFQRTITPRGREAMATLPFEARPSLSQISKSRATDITENITESSLLGGGRITAGKARAEQAAQGLLEQEIGLLPAKGDPRLNRMSATLDELGGDVVVNTERTREAAVRLLKKERPLGEFADDKFTAVMKKIIGLGTPEEVAPGIAATTGPAGFTAQVGGTPAVPPVMARRQISFTDARGMRAQLLEMARSPVGALASKSERGAVRHLEKLLKQDMLESAAMEGRQMLVRTYQDFNKIARQASTRGHFEDAITKATTVTADGPFLDGNKLVNNLYHAKKELRGSMDPEALSRAEHFSRVLQTAQSKSTEGTGRVMVQLTQAGAVGAVATGALSGKALAVLGIPYVMSRALTSPRLYRYLTEGFQHVGTPRGNAAINALLAEVTKEEQAEAASVGEKKAEEPQWTPPWEQ